MLFCSRARRVVRCSPTPTNPLLVRPCMAVHTQQAFLAPSSNSTANVSLFEHFSEFFHQLAKNSCLADLHAHMVWPVTTTSPAAPQTLCRMSAYLAGINLEVAKLIRSSTRARNYHSSLIDKGLPYLYWAVPCMAIDGCTRCFLELRVVWHLRSANPDSWSIWRPQYREGDSLHDVSGQRL